MITAMHVSILGGLLSGVEFGNVPHALVTGLTAAAGTLLSDVPEIDRATIDVVWAKFTPGENQAPAFFFRPTRDDKTQPSDVGGCLVPRNLYLPADGMTLYANNPPDTIRVLWPLPPGPSAEISASVFCGIEGRQGEYRKVLHGREQGLPAGPGRQPVDVPNLHHMLDTVISDVASGGVSSYMAGLLEKAGFKTVGQLVLAAEDQVVKALNFAERGGTRRLKFNSWLADLSERAGILLRLGMSPDDLHGWQPRGTSSAGRAAPQTSGLQDMLNREVGSLGLSRRTTNLLVQRHNLFFLGAILQLSADDLIIKIGRKALKEINARLPGFASECKAPLFFGMTDDDMQGWARRHGRPVTTGTSVDKKERRRRT